MLGAMVQYMKVFRTHWWSVQLPENWEAEQDDVCVTFTSNSSSGTLQVSAAQNSNGPVTDEDLLEFAEEHLEAGVKPHNILAGNFRGFYIRYSDDEFYYKNWWLRNDNTVVFITYTTDIEQCGQDDTVIEQIVNSLVTVSGSNA